MLPQSDNYIDPDRWLHSTAPQPGSWWPTWADWLEQGQTQVAAVAVQCESLRQTWRIDGSWQPWEAPMPGSVGQRIVLDLCSNTLDGPAVPVPPPPP